MPTEGVVDSGSRKTKIEPRTIGADQGFRLTVVSELDVI